MRESTKYIRQHIREAWDLAKLQGRAFAGSVFLLALMYAMSIHLSPGWLSWALMAPSAAMIVFIALVRINAIGPEKMGMVWHARRAGLVIICIGAVSLLVAPFTHLSAWPTWRAVVFTNGTAIVLCTTPGLPPFWRYWSGGWRNDLPPRSPLTRFLFWLEARKRR